MTFAAETAEHEESKRRADQLQKTAWKWESSPRIRSFLEACERVLPERAQDDIEQEQVRLWLEWGQQVADWLDPLKGGGDDARLPPKLLEILGREK